MKEQQFDWQKPVVYAVSLFVYVLIRAIALVEIPLYYLGMVVVRAIKIIVTEVKKGPQVYEDLVCLLKASSVEKLTNDFIRKASLSRRAQRRAGRVVKRSVLWEFAIHEAGHVVLILKSSYQRNHLVNAIIWSRTQQNARKNGYKCGAVRYEVSTPFTHEMVLGQLAVIYAGLLAVNCLLNIAHKEGHSVSDLRRADEASSQFANIVVPGLVSSASYAWFLRMLAWRHAKKVLIAEKPLVVAIAKRLMQKKDTPVTKEELLEIERNVVKGTV